mmetsp:Transcript_3747/g.9550  ORF Transcript_3747/g.9550 Transcript_3747/m.9550 type:complete len:628 (+) Transcript_3747:271-2154(+)|eukprot:CAMPEP_0181101496 /NCGR_PEP_ID=MMETSP1071-20121207/13785_1 /TAXON_ID=35127 /ORGANISM="Thalassiosira sp., Strain NH16" /LENGTH=627 /DNA_ID=CAMNT_0023184351 /DNA_START=271 /DNA_END=2154 /DNA_ORIENTATION=+
METPSSPIRGVSLLSDQSAASAAAARSATNFWAAPLAVSNNSFATNGPLKLTLSAYCRPENTVRLTDASPAQIIHAKYELLDPSRCRTLGHGASSTVRLAYRRSDGQPVAVKTIAKHDALGLWSKNNRWRLGARKNTSSPRDAAGETRQQVKRTPRLDEVDVLTSLKDICPSMVQLLDVYETHQEVQLVLEYCEGGDLFDCIKRRKQMEVEPENNGLDPLIHGSFTEFETAIVAKTLLNVLDTLHSMHIVHRDIKPENILLSKEDDCLDQLGAVKLTDFGLARLLHDDSEASSKASLDSEDMSVKQRSRAYSRVGSDYYAAPEVHMGLGYDTPVDIYSLGVTLYVMLCGTPPSSTSFFKSEDFDFSDEDSSCVASVSEESSQSSHCSGSELFPSELKISPSAQDLISKMIHPDPEKRIDASEALKHQWITIHSVEEETHKMIHVTSKISLTSSTDTTRTRTLSFAETESFLRIGPALPVVPPSNSPTLKLSKVGFVGSTPEACVTPTSSPLNPDAPSISLTLADVCNKLAPLVDEQWLHKQRKQRQRSHSHGDKVCFMAPRKHSRCGGSSGDRLSKKKRSPTTKKRVRLELHPDLAPNSTYNRIGRRFNSPIPIFGPVFHHHPECPE